MGKPAPVQLPADAETARPATGTSLALKTFTLGGSTFTGFGPAITVVGSEVADVDPLVPDAVTRTRSRMPTSAATTLYDDAVAPEMSAQTFPSGSQRSHWYAKLVAEPPNVPVDENSVPPWAALPVITGRAVFVGAVGCQSGFVSVPSS